MIEGNSVKKGTGKGGAVGELGRLVSDGKGTVFFGSASGDMRIGRVFAFTLPLRRFRQAYCADDAEGG
jgi:hypothetical protein